MQLNVMQDSRLNPEKTNKKDRTNTKERLGDKQQNEEVHYLPNRDSRKEQTQYSKKQWLI